MFDDCKRFVKFVGLEAWVGDVWVCGPFELFNSGPTWLFILMLMVNCCLLILPVVDEIVRLLLTGGKSASSSLLAFA